MKNHELKALNLLYDAALVASYKYRVKIVSGIVYNKELICISTNEYKSHPFQKKYSKNDAAIYLHAEIAAGINAIKKIGIDKLKNSTIMIVRLRKNTYKKFQLAAACPCEGCSKFITAMQFSKTIFSNENDGFTTIQRGEVI